MTTQTLTNDCKFCSLVSKTNGEDPIGTANPADGWVIVEIPQPWTKESMMAHLALSQMFQTLRQGGRKLMPIAITSDPKYTVPGLVRLLFYQQSNTPFARYDKQEFLVPENQLLQLTEALLQQPKELERFLYQFFYLILALIFIVVPNKNRRKIMSCSPFPRNNNLKSSGNFFEI